MRTPDQLRNCDEIDRLLIQANAITGLLRIEPADECVRADDDVMNAAWLLSDMLHSVQVLLQENERLAEVDHGLHRDAPAPAD
jgi:hypothetical protein